jgi:hypothetical protein
MQKEAFVLKPMIPTNANENWNGKNGTQTVFFSQDILLSSSIVVFLSISICTGICVVTRLIAPETDSVSSSTTGITTSAAITGTSSGASPTSVATIITVIVAERDSSLSSDIASVVTIVLVIVVVVLVVVVVVVALKVVVLPTTTSSSSSIASRLSCAASSMVVGSDLTQLRQGNVHVLTKGSIAQDASRTVSTKMRRDTAWLPNKGEFSDRFTTSCDRALLAHVPVCN